MLYNHANFYRFEETSSYWSVIRRSFFLCFSFGNQRHISAITVYNRKVTNIENTVRAVHSCNNWLSLCLCKQGIAGFILCQRFFSYTRPKKKLRVLMNFKNHFVFFIHENSSEPQCYQRRCNVTTLHRY